VGGGLITFLRRRHFVFILPPSQAILPFAKLFWGKALGLSRYVVAVVRTGQLWSSILLQPLKKFVKEIFLVFGKINIKQ